ncbi:Hypothetical_protein [Hexamita inflata]|uniref:Hypothetical_protein n=1 Tax=Hexamita inflata TaxID=28002 RepID=A0AA86NST7_9EUKA|nr:Hypothetical protein HINF_LOCUS12158 [Hexamita inflata]CAI9924514.1 Hypothetical protein HINF_LOCUS12159 [Hexamita inflata]
MSKMQIDTQQFINTACHLLNISEECQNIQVVINAIFDKCSMQTQQQKKTFLYELSFHLNRSVEQIEEFYNQTVMQAIELNQSKIEHDTASLNDTYTEESCGWMLNAHQFNNIALNCLTNVSSTPMDSQSEIVPILSPNWAEIKVTQKQNVKKGSLERVRQNKNNNCSMLKTEQYLNAVKLALYQVYGAEAWSMNAAEVVKTIQNGLNKGIEVWSDIARCWNSTSKEAVDYYRFLCKSM